MLGNFAESCFFSFWSAQIQKTNNNNNSLGSGGQRGWDLEFPALHRHHSGTGRQDTQNGKRCGEKRGQHDELLVTSSSSENPLDDPEIQEIF